MRVDQLKDTQKRRYAIKVQDQKAHDLTLDADPTWAVTATDTEGVVVEIDNHLTVDGKTAEFTVGELVNVVVLVTVSFAYRGTTYMLTDTFSIVTGDVVVETLDHTDVDEATSA
jgi:hypothetical protein